MRGMQDEQSSRRRDLERDASGRFFAVRRIERFVLGLVALFWLCVIGLGFFVGLIHLRDALALALPGLP